MPFCTSCGEALTGKTCVKCLNASGVRCHQCNSSISDPNEVLVIGGREYHRACKGFGNTSNLESAGGKWVGNKAELCPGCSKPVAKGVETDSDVVVVAGSTWHRACKGLGGDAQVKSWAGNKQDVCPGCSKPIAAGGDAANETVIIAGTPWHRACKGLTGEGAVKTWAGNKQDLCGGCHKPVTSGGDAANDTVIIAGTPWHRACKGFTGESTAAHSAISYADSCARCNKQVGLTDKVIVRGEVMHRQCWDAQSGVIS